MASNWVSLRDSQTFHCQTLVGLFYRTISHKNNLKSVPFPLTTSTVVSFLAPSKVYVSFSPEPLPSAPSHHGVSFKLSCKFEAKYDPSLSSGSVEMPSHLPRERYPE